MKRSMVSLHSHLEEDPNKNVIINFDCIQEKSGLIDEESETLNDDDN